jgi:hypothetical protein
MYSLYKNKCRIFKPADTTIKRGLKRRKMKMNQFRLYYIYIYIYMEMSQETLYVSILNKQKSHFFFIYKIREQEGRTGPVWGFGTSDGGRRWEKGIGG